MALATVNDVVRYLGESGGSVPSGSLQTFLDTADAWVKKVTGGAWDETTSQTTDFFMVDEGAILNLPDGNPTVTAVQVWWYSDNDDPDQFVVDDDYQVLDNGKVRLLDHDLITIPFEGAVAKRQRRELARVRITWTPGGSVPAPIREAVALYAAAMWRQAPMDASGLVTETLGSYNYSRSYASAVRPTRVPERVRDLIRPYKRKKTARVF